LSDKIMTLRNIRSTWFHYCQDIMLKYMDSTFETLERKGKQFTYMAANLANENS